jgi:hypothetical protein
MRMVLLGRSYNMPKNWLAIPAGEYNRATEILKLGRSVDDTFTVLYSWTAVFGDGIEMDIRVADAPDEEGGPWSEAALFWNGHELNFTKVSKTISGEWKLQDGDTTYIVQLVPRED